MLLKRILVCLVLKGIQTAAEKLTVNSTANPPKTIIILLTSPSERGEHSVVLLLSTFLLMAGILLSIYCICCRDELFSEAQRFRPRKATENV